MKKHAVLTLGFVLLSISAQAGNNPLIDQALNENLAEKKTLSEEIKQTTTADHRELLNSKYQAVEVLEVGDELGGFASSGDSATTK